MSPDLLAASLAPLLAWLLYNAATSWSGVRRWDVVIIDQGDIRILGQVPLGGGEPAQGGQRRSALVLRTPGRGILTTIILMFIILITIILTAIILTTIILITMTMTTMMVTTPRVTTTTLLGE